MAGCLNPPNPNITTLLQRAQLFCQLIQPIPVLVIVSDKQRARFRRPMEALHLEHPVLIGWSAGAWAIQSYFFAHSGLGAIGKAVLYASVPELLPPGTEDGGTHLSVRPETIDGLLRTYPLNPTVDPPSPNDDLL